MRRLGEFSRWLLLLIAGLSITACTQRQHGASPAPCALKITPSSVALVTTPYRQTSAKISIESANEPSGNCLVSAAFESVAGFQVVAPLAQPFILTAREGQEIEIAFTSSSAGKFESTLALRTGSDQQLFGRVPVRALVEDNCLNADPPSLNFDKCVWDTATLTLRNGCHGTISVDDLSIEPDDTFAFLDRPLAPFELEVGHPVALRLASLFATNVPQTGRVVASSPAGVVNIPLHGAALTATLVRQTFTQPEEDTHELDVLVVVDASTSMQDVQYAVSQQLMMFFDNLNARPDIDFHLAVTTSSVDAANGGSGNEAEAANGGFLPLSGGSPRVLTRTTANVRQSFASIVASIGVSSTEPEQLLRATELALTQPLLGTTNAGFLRDTASLLVVLITDGDDRGTVAIPHYEAFLSNLDGPNSHVSLAGIAEMYSPAPPSGCTYDPLGASERRVATLARQMNRAGLADFCWDDWGSALSEFLPGRSPPLRWQFALSGVLNTSGDEPIRVFVDGVKLAPSVDFMYRARENEIEVETPLNYGSTIEIEYSAYCVNTGAPG